MGSVRYFTVEEANDLVPQLSMLMGEQMKLLVAIEEHVRALSSLIGPIDEASARPSEADPPIVREKKEALAQAVHAYREGWSKIEETGALIKDPRLGLLDFYGRVNGETVFLCWQYGEPEIGYFHSVDTGYAARKPLPTLSAVPALN
ncbi:MAG: DUF2203 domain-containing protein [Deltaproteobacteria bacterium]|nr:DUF2203 domain-containing protein [Deltaproteobacteria bacterium]